MAGGSLSKVLEVAHMRFGKSPSHSTGALLTRPLCVLVRARPVCHLVGTSSPCPKYVICVEGLLGTKQHTAAMPVRRQLSYAQSLLSAGAPQRATSVSLNMRRSRQAHAERFCGVMALTSWLLCKGRKELSSKHRCRFAQASMQHVWSLDSRVMIDSCGRTFRPHKATGVIRRVFSEQGCEYRTVTPTSQPSSWSPHFRNA